MQGGDGGPAVVVGDSRASLLMKAIEYNDPDLAMPPKDAGGKLSPEKIEILAKWIRMGLPDPRKRTSAKHETQDYDEAKKWWSFQPMKQPTIPKSGAKNVSNEVWPRNDIDRLIEAARTEKGLKPAPDATPGVLLRRIHFDLTGLPPTVDELNSFQSAVQSAGIDKAIEARVDRLLESPQFGVQWGRHWLDVARYAESSGRDVNVAYPHAWRYRDWVIQAFNNDKPYDQFLRTQIAGDLIHESSPAKQSENIIATGFLAIGSRSINEMNPKQFAVDQADEQIDTVFQASMGLTVSCARCHDHKFDPIPQKDYTAVAGIFLSTATHFGGYGANQNRNPSDLIALPRGHGQKLIAEAKSPSEVAGWKKELEEVESQFTAFRKEVVQKRRKMMMGSSDDNSMEPMKDQGLIRQRRQLDQRRDELEALIEEYDEDGRPRGLAMGVSDKPRETNVQRLPRQLVSMDPRKQRNVFTSVGDSPLFARGDIELPGDRVPRGIPSTLTHSPKFDIPAASSGRRELAEWITRANNTLTARVAVNRIWTQLIGQGLVTSTDNFGTTGSTPSHPELLDYLALKFIEQGWSTKKLIRQIVLSRTYQMSSRFDESAFGLDPENTMLWRMNSKRLPGESIRDGILTASNTLDLEPVAGSPIALAGYGRVERALQIQRRRNREMNQLESNSRSIYLGLSRGSLPELLEVFDQPDANAVQGRRDATNVPSQSLYMLNSPWVATESKLIAQRIIHDLPGKMEQQIDPRIKLAYRITLAREPNTEEMRLAKDLINQLASTPEISLTSLARGLLASAEFRSVE